MWKPHGCLRHPYTSLASLRALADPVTLRFRWEEYGDRCKRTIHRYSIGMSTNLLSVLYT